MQKAIVLHSDILGFKKIIENAEKDKEEETLKKLKEAIQESIQFINSLKSSEIKPLELNINFKMFSDNLYASFSYEENNLRSFSNALMLAIFFTRSYFTHMLYNKIPIRGGISFGNDYYDDTIIFSIALVKAYTLETEKAIYPRVVIDSELIEIIMKEIELPSMMFLDILNNSILKDQENTYFINPNGLTVDFKNEFNGLEGVELDKIYIKKNIEFVEEELKKIINQTEENEKIVKKYEWLLDLLLWNFHDRKSKPFLNTFTPVRFKVI